MDIFTTAKVSPKGKLNTEDLKKMGVNAVMFTAPALAVLFGQLAMGVSFKAAILVALLVFWGLVADFFKKINQGK